MDQFVTLIQQYGYAVLLPLSIIEGPVISILGGFLVALGQLNGYVVFVVLLIGDIVGDLIYYAIGRFGRHAMMRRLLHYFGVTNARVQKLENYYGENSFKILLIGKTQPIGSLILIVAGIAHMPVSKFFWYNFALTIPKALLLQAAGYYFGEGILSTGGVVFDYAGLGSFFLVTALLGIYMFLKYYIKQKTPAIENDPKP